MWGGAHDARTGRRPEPRPVARGVRGGAGRWTVAGPVAGVGQRGYSGRPGAGRRRYAESGSRGRTVPPRRWVVCGVRVRGGAAGRVAGAGRSDPGPSAAPEPHFPLLMPYITRRC
ncbi:hypothetical protein GCM10010393_56240 [Streptomyces gobitricini]|uniref:Uncharacterized protein n=1 Tax=Streptomyces gobitricini TaxID=68211 RepID=A0ABP6AHM2_9ACTN